MSFHTGHTGHSVIPSDTKPPLRYSLNDRPEVSEASDQLLEKDGELKVY